jgi:uncharacterized damage-inducible protein DinB
MQPFTMMFKHNGWANQAVLDGFRGEHEVLLGTLAYNEEPLLDRIHHMAMVERRYLGTLRGTMERPDPPRDLLGLITYNGETTHGYNDFCGGLDVAGVDRKVLVPWWQREFAVRDMLLQVLSHSGQHRAELAWELARAGVDTGELDYIAWFASGQPEPGQPLPDE